MHPRTLSGQDFARERDWHRFCKPCRSMRALWLASALLTCAASFGCEAYLIDGPTLGGEGGAAGAATVVDTCATFYEDFEPTEDVSFRQDLVPILQTHCNANICHGGDHEKAQASLWLGPEEGQEASDEDLWFVYRSLIDIRSTVAPRLALVRGGNAKESYFMRKLDDCHDPEGLECTLGSGDGPEACGDAMPVLSAALPEEERSLFRSWIANGAPEN